MKFFKLIILSCLLTLTNCSKESSPEKEEENSKNYAMTATVDGVKYEMNNPFGGDFAVRSIFSYYPDSDYIQLQGRNGGILGDPEINIWFNRNDLKVGTYQVNADTDGVTTHIDIIDNRNSIFENTISGNINIEFIDPLEKIVKGSFQFLASGGFSNPDFRMEVTEGTFNYRYDVDY